MSEERDLAAQLQASKQEETELSYREGSIDEEIRAAARQVHESRKTAALDGGDVLQTSGPERVAELKQLKESLPYLRWSARIKTLQLGVELMEQRLASMHPTKEQTAELEEANKEAAAASERQKEAQQAVELAVAGRFQVEQKLVDYRRDLEEVLASEPEQFHLIPAGYRIVG